MSIIIFTESKQPLPKVANNGSVIIADERSNQASQRLQTIGTP